MWYIPFNVTRSATSSSPNFKWTAPISPVLHQYWAPGHDRCRHPLDSRLEHWLSLVDILHLSGYDLPFRNALPTPIPQSPPNTPFIPLGLHTPNLPPLYQHSVWNRGKKWIRKRKESRHIDLSERLTQTLGCLLTSALPSLSRKSRGLTTSETDPKGCASDRLRIS